MRVAIARATNGRRITRSLADPRAKEIAASEWLLLFTIQQNPDLTSLEISRLLTKSWRRVKKEKRQFYITWPPGYDVETELIRFKEIGLLRVSKWENGRPCWALTEKGAKVLGEWKKTAKDKLGSVTEDVLTRP